MSFAVAVGANILVPSTILSVLAIGLARFLCRKDCMGSGVRPAPRRR